MIDKAFMRDMGRQCCKLPENMESISRFCVTILLFPLKGPVGFVWLRSNAKGPYSRRALSLYLRA